MDCLSVRAGSNPVITAEKHKARSSNGRMRDPHSRGMGSIPIRVTDIAKWRNRYTRDAQNVVSARTCEFDPRLGYLNIAGATGVQLAFIRPVRSARYRDLQLDADGPVLSGVSYAPPAGCDPRIRYLNLTGYANRQSEQAENL